MHKDSDEMIVYWENPDMAPSKGLHASAASNARLKATKRLKSTIIKPKISKNNRKGALSHQTSRAMRPSEKASYKVPKSTTKISNPSLKIAVKPKLLKNQRKIDSSVLKSSASKLLKSVSKPQLKNSKPTLSKNFSKVSLKGSKPLKSNIISKVRVKTSTVPKKALNAAKKSSNKISQDPKRDSKTSRSTSIRVLTPRQQLLAKQKLAVERKHARESSKSNSCDDSEGNSQLNSSSLAAHNAKHAKDKDSKQYWRKSKASKWEGNSDDQGSVDSGLLEENICFECGLCTMNDDWTNLVLCDVCDGEYHLTCIHRDSVPRVNYTCHRCVEEINEFRNLKYVVKNSGFPVKRRRGTGPPSFCYSPSRPLEIAWKECQDKGFMVVSRLLSFEVMKKLTHGTIERLTASGRVAEVWPGVIEEMEKRVKSSCKNLVIRGGRFDLRIPEFVIQSLKLDEILLPVTEKLRTIMGTPKPELRTHNIVWVPVGSPEQHWHYDDKSTKQAKNHRYFTILAHLNTIDTEAGGTEIWSKKLRRADMVRPRPGDAFVFNGTLMHRGQANNGSSNRFFYYASYSCSADANTVELA